MQDRPERVSKDIRFLVEHSAQPRFGVKLSVQLPTWESFPTRDRQLLVSTIVQTARRRVHTNLTGQPLAARRSVGHD